SSQLTPPPPPPSTDTNRGNPQQSSRAPSSSKTADSTQQSLAWTTSDTRYKSTTFTATQETSPTDNLINDDSILDEQNNWASALVLTYVPPAENSLLAKTGDMMTFMNWYCQKVNKTMLIQANFKGKAYEVVKAFYPDIVHLQIDVSRPLPLSGPPGHVTILTQFFFNKDLDYLRYGSKGSGQALSISKIKVARYLDFGLELLVHEDMWINDVKDLQLGIESYQKQLNLTKPGWDAIGYEYKHDYTIIESPRAVVFLVSNNE
ncbi:hypothetical protein Tco_1138972, partial [Tanacetum coccineum]